MSVQIGRLKEKHSGGTGVSSGGAAASGDD